LQKAPILRNQPHECLSGHLNPKNLNRANPESYPMKKQTVLTAAILAAFALTARSQVLLSLEHVDIGIGYNEAAWNLYVHDVTHEQEYEPDEAIFYVSPDAEGTVPSDVRFNFLGAPGASIWILPQVGSPELLFLGVGAGLVGQGTFLDDLVTLSLVGYSGPSENAHFALYQTDGDGAPTVFMDTRDGIDGTDYIEITAGNHAHFHWAFSETGTHTIVFEASAVLNQDSILPVYSGPVGYTFQVAPEPSAAALFMMGAVFAICFRRRA
jgi:surface-anchored protein